SRTSRISAPQARALRRILPSTSWNRRGRHYTTIGAAVTAQVCRGGCEMLTRVIASSVVLVSALVVALAAGAPGPASAAPAGDGGGLLGVLNLNTQTQIDDLFATEDPSILSSDPGTMHFGPYPSTTGDSGTCGPDWATDTVNRFFMIKQVTPTTFSVVQKFKGGTFLTPVSPPFGPDPMRNSPGACDSSDGTPPG